MKERWMATKDRLYILESSTIQRGCVWHFLCNVAMRRWKVVTGLFLAWFMILVYMSSSLVQVDVVSSAHNNRLQKTLDELQHLKEQNLKLRSLTGHLSDSNADNFNKRKVKEFAISFDKSPSKFHSITDGPLKVQSVVAGPSAEHEERRRKVTNDVREFWWYIRSQLAKSVSLTSSNDLLATKLQDMLATGTEYYRTLSNDLKDLRESDGGEDWRRKESEELGKEVRERIRSLQNPADCKKAKKILCSLSKGCGYGCQLHHVTYCLIMAYSTGRVLILKSVGWRYARGGWETVFLPISDSCAQKGSDVAIAWERSNKDTPIIELPIIDSLQPRPKQLPLSIPSDLAKRLTHFHGDPITWWVGQFVRYLCRPQPHLQTYINQMKEKFGFAHPIVGVQVRRTDKVGTEASFHSISEYMKHVEDYYSVLSQKRPVPVRRVYLATDDDSVVAEARQKYPQYTFISDTGISQSASLSTRYSDASLRGVILDIHLLSLTDYIVCTFSSQVCRVAYELLQTYNGDASSAFYSLDDIYYFGGQNAHNVRAIEPHAPRTSSEISLEVGDLIAIAGNHWDGFSKGLNYRTGRTGVFPSYKVTNVVDVAHFATQGRRSDR